MGCRQFGLVLVLILLVLLAIGIGFALGLYDELVLLALTGVMLLVCLAGLLFTQSRL